MDGMIIAACSVKDLRALRVLRQNRIPFVCLSRRADSDHGDFVGIDYDAASSQLMQHMLSHGYRDIATVIGPRVSTASLQRENAFVRTAAEAGIAVQGARKISTRVNNEGGRAAAKSLLESRNPPAPCCAVPTRSPSASWNTPCRRACGFPKTSPSPAGTACRTPARR